MFEHLRRLPSASIRLGCQLLAPLWQLAGEHRYGLYVITRPDAAGYWRPAGPATGGGCPAKPRQGREGWPTSARPSSPV